MAPPIPPALEHTAYRRIIDGTGVQLPGRFSLQFLGDFFTIADAPESSTLKPRTTVAFSGSIQPAEGIDLLLKNGAGVVMITIDEDGIYFGDQSGEPTPHVSAGRAVRDLELEVALQNRGLILVDP